MSDLSSSAGGRVLGIAAVSIGGAVLGVLLGRALAGGPEAPELGFQQVVVDAEGGVLTATELEGLMDEGVDTPDDMATDVSSTPASLPLQPIHVGYTPPSDEDVLDALGASATGSSPSTTEAADDPALVDSRSVDTGIGEPAVSGEDGTSADRSATDRDDPDLAGGTAGPSESEPAGTGHELDDGPAETTGDDGREDQPEQSPGNQGSDDEVAPADDGSQNEESSGDRGGEAGEDDESGGEGGMTVYDPLGTILAPYPVPVHDRCAGAEPETPVPDDCPDGVGAVVLAQVTPPPANGQFVIGHRLVTDSATGEDDLCPTDTPVPAAGEVAMTMLTDVPIDSVLLHTRPFGANVNRSSNGISIGSSPSQIERWERLLGEREYSRSWGLTAVCFNMPHPDAAAAHELVGWGTDIYGRSVAIEGLVPPEQPLDRAPPTTGRIDATRSRGIVQARTVESGDVRFTSRFVDRDDEMVCPTSGTRQDGFRGARSLRDTPLEPTSVYDPAFAHHFTADFDLPPGGHVLVCVAIHETTNPLHQPLRIDRLLLSAPTQLQPRIVVERIITSGDPGFEPSELVMSSTRSNRQCGRFFILDSRVGPRTSFDVEETVYRCTTARPYLPGGAGILSVDLDVKRVVERNDRGESIAGTATVRIPVHLDDCRTSCPSRVSEWYAANIPTREVARCRSSRPASECPGIRTDSTAVIRVDYRRVEGLPSYNGRVDVLDAAPVPERPDSAVVRLTTDFEPVGTLQRTLRVSLVADRPVRASVETIEETRPGFDSCHPGGESPMADEPAETIEIEIPGLCAGTRYELVLRVVDEAGVESQRRGGTVFVPVTAARFDTTVEFLDGPPEGYSRIIGLEVGLNGSNATSYWWNGRSNAGFVGRGDCSLLGSLVLSSRGPAVGHEARFWGGVFEIDVVATIAPIRRGRCDGETLRPGPFDIEFTALVDVDDLRNDEPIVVDTGDEFDVRLRVTLTRRSNWFLPPPL